MITIKQIVDKMNEWYDKIYDAQVEDDENGTLTEIVDSFTADEVQDLGSGIFDAIVDKNKEFIGKVAKYREDFISSDREAAALIWALHDLGLLDWDIVKTGDSFDGKVDDYIKVEQIDLEEELEETYDLDEDVYEDNGFEDRDDYLQSLADEYGVDVSTVKEISSVLGEEEDFDGLPSSLEFFNVQDDYDVDELLNISPVEKEKQFESKEPVSKIKELREDDNTNAAMEVMAYNDQFQGEPNLGCFWYDPEKEELFGVGKSPARDLEWYFSKQFGKEIRTGHALHKNIWNKEQHRGKDNRFNGNFTKKPRGRVFEFKDDGFKVMTGSWINYYPEAKEEIIYEFDLPEDNTEFIIDRHWDLGHGWSDDFLESLDESVDEEEVKKWLFDLDTSESIGSMEDIDDFKELDLTKDELADKLKTITKENGYEDKDIVKAQDYLKKLNESLEENSNKYRRVKKALFGDKNGRIKTFAIISPCNPNAEQLSAEENNKRVDSFKKTLNDGHFPYTQFKGKYGNDEKSFLIVDISQEQARHFAELYGQESFFWGTNNKDKNSTISYYERKSPNSPKYDLIETSDTIEDASDAEDFFSKYGDIKFQIKMDYFEDFDIPEVDEELLEKSFNTPGFNGYVKRARAYKKAKNESLKEANIGSKWNLSYGGKDYGEVDLEDKQFNIGSNKNIDVGSEPYNRIKAVCDKLNDMDLVDKWHNDPVVFTVEETYEDYGAGMKWKTIICTEQEGGGDLDSHQVLNPKLWLDIANGTVSTDEAVKEIMNGEYCQFKEAEKELFRKSNFSIDGLRGTFDGYTNDMSWNGYAVPFFEKDQADLILKEVQETFPDSNSYFDKDTYYIGVFDDEELSYDEFKGVDVETKEGTKHVYPIGCYSWTWEEKINEELKEEKLDEMAMERSKAIDRCISLGEQFVEHFDKVYNDNDEETIKHHGEEMQGFLDQVLSIKLKENHKPLNEKQIYDWFITCGQLPVDLFDNETEASVYDEFGNDLLDEDKDVLEALKRIELLNESLTESSVAKDNFDISDSEKVSLFWDKNDGWCVEKIFKASKGDDTWQREWIRTYPSEKEARRAFDRQKKLTEDVDVPAASYSLQFDSEEEAKKAAQVLQSKNLPVKAHTDKYLEVFIGDQDKAVVDNILKSLGIKFINEDWDDFKYWQTDAGNPPYDHALRLTDYDKSRYGYEDEDAFQDDFILYDEQPCKATRVSDSGSKDQREDLYDLEFKDGHTLSNVKGWDIDFGKEDIRYGKKLDEIDEQLNEDWTYDVPKADKQFISDEVKGTLSDVKYGTMNVNNGHERIMSAIADTLDNPIEEELYEYNEGVVVDEDFDEDFDDTHYYAYEIKSDMSGTSAYLLNKDYNKLQKELGIFKKDFKGYLDNKLDWEDLEDKYEEKGFILGDNETEEVYQAPLNDEDDESEMGYFYDGKPVEIVKKDHWRF